MYFHKIFAANISILGGGIGTRTQNRGFNALTDLESAVLPLDYSPILVRWIGFEPIAYDLEGRCSIQLSYKRIGRLSLPRQIRLTEMPII